MGNIKKNRSNLKLKIAIAIVLVVIWIIVGMFRYVNSPKIQSMIYSSFNRVSTLKIRSAELKLEILKRKITISNINLLNSKKDQLITADRIVCKFRILPLFKAGISITDLNIENLRIKITKPEKDEIRVKRPGIGLANLLLLRNLKIKNGIINKAVIDLPNNSIIIDKTEINFVPSLWGNINLSLKFSSLRLSPESGKPPLMADEVVLGGSTDLNDWADVFPYINNINGVFGVKNLKWKDLLVDAVESKLAYSDMELNLKSFKSYINGHLVEIDGKVNGKTEKYSLNIDIPEPISLPHLGRETSFLDTSGSIVGKISINGTGLNYKNTNASADVDFHHNIGKSDPLPAALVCKAEISNGAIRVSDAILNVENTTVNVNGSFNYVNPNLELSFSGENIPVDTVMNRFYNKHYHPTNGVANAIGHLTGWKSNLKFTLDVEAEPASYYDIHIERLKMNLDITYNELMLTGTLFQGDNAIANVELKMQMGAKLADGTRYKTFELNASLNNFDTASSMAEYGLTGIGNGSITLKGTPNSYTGSSSASIENGSVKGVVFRNLKSNIEFSHQKIVFKDIVLALSDTNPMAYSSPLTMDVTGSGLRLYGTPRDGLTIDSRYNSDSGSWSIDKLTYASLTNPDWESSLTGTIGKEGELNLKATGTFDTSLLANLRGFIREAKGPAELKNLHIGGTSKDTSITGVISLDNNDLQSRNLGYFFDSMVGDLNFSGHTIATEGLSGRIEYGNFTIKGLVRHQNNSITFADIYFDGKSVLYAIRNRSFRVELDCNLAIKGSPSSSEVSGNINILDGRYTKNFSIFESMKTGSPYKEIEPVETAWKNMKLDLKIKTTGDLQIDNNIGEVWLAADLTVTGFKSNPHIAGNIESQGGEIHYAGMEFEVTRGYMEFRDPYTNPYLEITGAKEVGSYNILLTIKGRIDKLYIDLSSTPPLEKRDVLALLMYGVTDEDLKQAQFGFQLGTGVAAEQIGSILQGPVTKFTPLDRFRIEAAPRTSGQNVTRLHMGKDISDRLKIHFITDVNAADAQQTFQADYMITDFLLLKGARLSGNNYRFHLSFRFREQ